MSRHGKRWTVNEILTLQREYELLQLSVEEIASRHERSEEAIEMKLAYEEFTSKDDNEEEELIIDVESVDNDSNNFINVESQNVRIDRLEYAVEEITHVVEEMLKRLTSPPSSRSKKTNQMYL